MVMRLRREKGQVWRYIEKFRMRGYIGRIGRCGMH